MQLKRTLIAYSVTAALVALSGTAAASGFALIEQSASGLGNAFAGGAASAEDASTIFFNPAGMSRLEGKQIAVAVHGIQPSMKFADNGLTTKTGGNGGDAGGMNYAPNFYYAMNINPNVNFGIGINAPFGLKTEYNALWAGRYQGIKTDVKSININPSISYKVNDVVSLGVGVSYQKFDANFTQAVFTGGPDALFTFSGNDSNWGYNIGALFQTNQNTRFGMAYRSAIKQKLTGSYSITAPVSISGVASLDLKLPDEFSVSGFHQLDSKWDLMADISWTGWSNLQKLELIKSTGGAPLLSTPYNWRNTYRISLGASYKYNDKWTSRVGIAIDQSPIPDANRTVRLPDSDRTWLSLGGKYKISDAGAVDFGYAHLFMKNAPIDNSSGGNNVTSALLYGRVAGTYSNSVDILSVQYTHNF